ncbi:MAG: MoxR family ATPase [Lachnospiraceae bacterium]
MNAKINQLVGNIEKNIKGKQSVILKVIIAMLCDGHVLIEDVPGIGKTQLILALAKSVNGRFSRVQLTPDIMPSDILGFTMIDPKTKEFVYHPGVAICNFLLADEINRASPKAQSSLLEIMEERQITLDGQTHPLPSPFITFATQNPVENHGTYHLPEAQMDRFLMRLSIGYPSRKDEMEILELHQVKNQALPAVWELSDIAELQKQVEKVGMQEGVKAYMMNLVQETRTSEYVTLGVSPRGSIALYKASKAVAFLAGRNYVTPNDIRAIAVDVLAHRIILSAKGRTTFIHSTTYVQDVLERLSVTVTAEGI